ncbi:MAG: hypothetical protein R2824_07055 [Saprospiraceae bacterium]|nr:hypothetical protein [Lewinella sp.]
MNHYKTLIYSLLLVFIYSSTYAQELSERENEYYRMITLPTPEGVLLEVGGMATLEDGRIALCTRRGEVWIVENPDLYEGSSPRYTLFANGLHEPLGLSYRDNAIYIAQRGELTKLMDTNGDGTADVYETIYAWPLSGHYHEYSYGPKFLPDGSMIVTGNVAFGDEEWWRGESRVPWRGWAMRITEDGEMQPWATGMRSPCGLGIYDGEFFYADNQGDWMGSGGVWHMPKGSFSGHPAGLKWTGQPDSPIELTESAFYSKIDKRQVKEHGRYVKPANIQDEENPDLLFKAKEEFPEIQLPAVWLPHGVLGISNSEIVENRTSGEFGPFDGQLFVGDQGQSKIMRVDLEKVNGEYQGVAFDFRSGFQSGVLRMTWGHDGSMYVGETNRGWGSAGTTTSGLERLVWTGEVPFEMKTVHAKPDGFEIEFTKPVDKASAKDIDSYTGRSFIYKYHAVYGSPTINNEPLVVKGVKISDDGMKVRVVVENMRQYYVHEIQAYGIKAADGQKNLLHPTGFYTLNNIPEGPSLPASELSTYSSAAEAAAKAAAEKAKASASRKKKASAPKVVAAANAPAPTYDEIQPLLEKNTCVACHRVDTKQVGPAFKDVAKRKYSVERIVELIYSPEPANWPGYATPMAPMPQVPRAEAMKIATWINSLR